VEYEVAMMSRLPEFVGLFHKRSLCFQGFFAKETWECREPTHRDAWGSSHVE